LPKSEREARGSELLARVGLTEAADRKVNGYSGGMKRRLDLALALLHRPRLLFLDEPTTGLDPQSRAALWDEVRRLAQEGVTVFLTTQYLEEADVLADRERLAGVLHRFGEQTAASAGGVAAQLPEGVGDLAEIVRVLDSEGIKVADLRVHSPTLDDVFLAKTGRSLEGASDHGVGGSDDAPVEPVAA